MPRRSASADPADPAPALSRGVALLDLLNRDGPQGLERLAAASGSPKSTALRLLAALERLGLVARDPATRRFHARATLVRGGDEGAEAARVRQLLAGLARDAGHAAEWWEVRDGGLVMTDRADPEDATTAVRARIGFARDAAEADAVVLVAMAAGAVAAPARQHQCRDRREVAVGRAAIAAQVAASRTAGAAADAGVNANGVRRFAAPVLRDGVLRGIVAIAQGGGVPPGADDGRLLALVAAAARG